MKSTSTANSSFSLSAYLIRLCPEDGVGHLFMWTSFPCFLLLLNLGISHYIHSLFTPYLPFLGLALFALTLYFKTKGLSASYVCLTLFLLFYIPSLSYRDQLWQMGIVFSLALTLFILLLVVEEIEESWSSLSQQVQKEKSVAHQYELSLIQTQREADAKERELEEEIRKLKEAAEQRRIEKTEEVKKIGLLIGEITLLTEQKNEFIHEAREACYKASQAIQEKEWREVESRNAMELFSEVIHQLQESLLTQQRLSCSTNKKVTHENPTLEELEGVKKKLILSESLHAQLRQQFQEKSRILDQTRKELFSCQGEIELLLREQERVKQEVEGEEKIRLEKEIALLVGEIETLEIEVKGLEELISRILNR